MRIVFDLDGTLADATHREHFINGETKDWDAFFEACDGDRPIRHTLHVLRSLAVMPGNVVEIWSGRGEGAGKSVRRKTLAWLRQHAGIVVWYKGDGLTEDPPAWGCTVGLLQMRQHGDHTPDHELKRNWLFKKWQSSQPVDMAFDDRDKVVAMWREAGVPCFQVAPGDF